MAITFLLTLCLCSASLPAQPAESSVKKEVAESERPAFLYKILSHELWQASQNEQALSLSADDASFIHFSTEDQLDKILAKYWSNHPDYVILKVDASKLEGELVYETNPGGSVKYYHLYQGSIPTSSIVESKAH